MQKKAKCSVSRNVRSNPNNCFCDFVNPCYFCIDQGKAPKYLDVIMKGDKRVQLGPKGVLRGKTKRHK